MRCRNDLQTNGTLLTDEWCEFLTANDFLVGLSIVEPRNFTTVAPQHWAPADIPAEGSGRADPSHPDSFLAPLCVGSEQYGDFLIKVFDEWLAHDFGQVYVPFFDSAVEQWMGRPSPLCIFSPICGKGVAMEHNGDVYACDHYVYPECRLGNINSLPLSEMALSRG